MLPQEAYEKRVFKDGIRKREKYMEEKYTLAPRAAEELRRTIVRFESVAECYKDVYFREKVKPEDKTAVILAIGNELKRMENYFLTLNELEDIIAEDRLQMTKVLRRKFFELVKYYI